MQKLTKQMVEKDSYVLGAIIAGIRISKKKLMPDVSAMEAKSEMCAVGAGLKGLKATRPSDILYVEDKQRRFKHQVIPLVRFAMAMDVSEDYACGVNDGFERESVARTFFPEVDLESTDYARGWAVGSVIRDEFCSV